MTEKIIDEVMGLVEAYKDAAISGYSGWEESEAIRAKLREVLEPKGMRLVNAGALQMVLNALNRDAADGKVSRGEMADELLKGVKQ